MCGNNHDELAISVVEDEQAFLFPGDPTQVKRWLDERGMTSYEFTAKVAGVERGVAKATEAATNASDRWVKLTKESAELVKQYGKAGTSSRAWSRSRTDKSSRGSSSRTRTSPLALLWPRVLPA